MDSKLHDEDSKLPDVDTRSSDKDLSLNGGADLREEPYHWWRGTLTQATILGICCFLAPGARPFLVTARFLDFHHDRI